MKKILLVFLILGTLSLNAQSCHTKNLKTNSQVHKAQMCLKRAIRKSKGIAQQYQAKLRREKKEIQKYKNKRALCRKYKIQGRYKKHRSCKAVLNRMNKKFREDEEDARFLKKQFVKFKQQIKDLKFESELLEMEYNSRR